MLLYHQVPGRNAESAGQVTRKGASISNSHAYPGRRTEESEPYMDPRGTISEAGKEKKQEAHERDYGVDGPVREQGMAHGEGNRHGGVAMCVDLL